MADISKINAVLLANIAEIDDVLAANIAKVNGLVFTTAPAFTGLLDTYTGATAAYSTRRLYGQYTGAALRVREDSGDTETDIGFDSNGDLDTAAIATHCGSANGYVTKWYGQESSGGTGSGNDAAQTTNANQPQIYDGSAVITENGKPALDFLFDDNRSFQNVTVSSFNTNDVGIFVVCTADSGHNSFATAVNIAPGASSEIAMAYRTEQISYATTVLGTGTSDTSQNLVSLYADNTSNDVRGYIDGTQLGTTTTSSNSGTGLSIANLRGVGSTYWEGTIQEMVFYASSSKSDHSGIEGNINAHFQIGNFGTPTSGLLYDYSGAAAAYSVRQLSNTSALSMRIREDGTDTETDIGFDSNGDLDTAAIASHCGANNGYVVTWYDQAGSQNDATQVTSGSQPQIYNGTAVITENGKAAIQFDGTLDSLDYDLATSLSAASYYHTFTVYQSSTTNSIYHGSRDTFAAYHFGLDGSTSTNLQGPMLADKTTFNHFYKNGSQSFTSSTTRDQYFTEYFTGDQTLMAYMMTVDSGSSNTTQWHIGRNKETLYGVDGNIQEFIVYQTDQTSNQSGIETNINSEYLIYQPTDAPTSGLLATYTGAAAAYSVRQLSDKAVIAMRIRRDSDDAETNIGFDSNGDLDTTAISDFCSTANGYVVEWADQSTNGNHASQSTSGSQPQIYNGTAVITENGKPALDFDGTSHVLSIGSSLGITGSQNRSFFVVLTADTLSTQSAPRPYIGLGDGSGATLGTKYNLTSEFALRVYGGFELYEGATTSTQYLATNIMDGTNVTDNAFYQNGSEVTATSSGTRALDTKNTSQFIGEDGANLSSRHDGTIQEVVIWSSAQTSNRSGIETNINNYFSIY